MADPEATERRRLALAAGVDTCKHVLTLTTAVVTLTISFAKDISADASASDLLWLRLSWLSHAVSVLAGVITLLALAGTTHEADENRSIYATNIRLPAAVQMIFFGLGVGFVVAFGALAV
ncbi:hypothetical protein GCM10010103_63930 [Streptomyces paradoxus]|uniref:Uncharacterized protein n=1 Tax=Streptomyces paradoxus TaxID=66375 RepID=A0A7W9WIM1_9ACTN|nr:hypothetical protein [Streptomyces paradoxus]MBB6080122.1 hypothetical protein [Streptomyces paradoxus]